MALRSPCQQPQDPSSRFLPAPQGIIWQSRERLRLSVGLRLAGANSIPAPMGPPPLIREHPGPAASLQASFKLGPPGFTAFSCSGEFQ